MPAKWQEKPCARPLCGGTVRMYGRPARFKVTCYCTQRCSTIAYAEACKSGRDQKAIHDAAVSIQRAIGISGAPSPELVRIVRRLRSRFYRQGWQVVARNVRRAIASGRLVDRRKQTAGLA